MKSIRGIEVKLQETFISAYLLQYNSVRQRYFSVTVLLLRSYLIWLNLVIFFLLWEIFVCTALYNLVSAIVAHLFLHFTFSVNLRNFLLFFHF